MIDWFRMAMEVPFVSNLPKKKLVSGIGMMVGPSTTFPRRYFQNFFALFSLVAFFFFFLEMGSLIDSSKLLPSVSSSSWLSYISNSSGVLVGSKLSSLLDLNIKLNTSTFLPLKFLMACLFDSLISLDRTSLSLLDIVERSVCTIRLSSSVCFSNSGAFRSEGLIPLLLAFFNTSSFGLALACIHDDKRKVVIL